MAADQNRTDSARLWERYKSHLLALPDLGFTLDISRMDFPDDFLGKMEPEMQKAFAAMAELENGAIANPDENRMVGHYWLRAPELAPDETIKYQIESAVKAIKRFAGWVHSGEVNPSSGGKFTRIILAGIGGSALGPQFVSDALTSADDPLKLHFCDNTDPDGIDRTLAEVGDDLRQTLTLVISKSGGTAETRNSMLEIRRAYESRDLNFPSRAVAITGEGSKLATLAEEEEWAAIFPMWDWVGGRTSELSAVGLLPAALQGFDIDELLRGAREMDVATRSNETRKNPAALMALMWHHATGGQGERDMVVLPYKDRLLLFSRYLQQLVMESLGKEKDLEGNIVHQGIAVYGNKGSTDQHAYVQQLREGVNNFFVTFIEVLKDREHPSVMVEENATSGDFLSGFLLGTRRALYENGRESMTITVDDVSAYTLGTLIALFERAVGFYATLVGINAYHQPGVEAGKKAAQAVLELQCEVLEDLGKNDEPRTAQAIAESIGQAAEVETVYKVLEHLASNPRGIERAAGDTPWDARYSQLADADCS